MLDLQSKLLLLRMSDLISRMHVAPTTYDVSLLQLVRYASIHAELYQASSGLVRRAKQFHDTEEESDRSHDFRCLLVENRTQMVVVLCQAVRDLSIEPTRDNLLLQGHISLFLGAKHARDTRYSQAMSESLTSLMADYDSAYEDLFQLNVALEVRTELQRGLTPKEVETLIPAF